MASPGPDNDDTYPSGNMVEVTEGLVTVDVPETRNMDMEEEPGARDAPVFYNPSMAQGRDISVLLLGAVAWDGYKVLDALSGTGIRAVRFAKEVDTPITVWANDIRPEAADLIGRNAERNDVEMRITQRLIHGLAGDEKFNYIDLDPFGSPSKFLPAAIQAVSRGGYLGVTATDTAALTGSSFNAAYRRYGVKVRLIDCPHEVGVRALAAAAVRMGAMSDHAVRPVLAHVPRYCYRLYFQVHRGRQRSDRMLSQLGWLLYDPSTLERKLLSYEEGLVADSRRPAVNRQTREAPRPASVTHEGKWLLGPLWMGPLYDMELLDRMQTRFDAQSEWGDPNGTARILQDMRHEDLGPFPYEAADLSAALKCDTPRWDDLVMHLERRGYRAARTHFDRRYHIRTDAPYSEMVEVYDAALAERKRPSEITPTDE